MEKDISPEKKEMSRFIRASLKAIADLAEEFEIRVNYDVRDGQYAI